MKDDKPKGVLNSNYASNRETSKVLNFRYKVRAEAVKYAVEKWTPEHSEIRMVDLGAAEGRTLEHLAKLLPLSSGVGIEYNADLIACCSNNIANNPSLKLIQGDVTDLNEIQENSFDLATALAVLEHIGDPSKVVREACRILKPGGIFVATSPIPFWDHLAVKLRLLKEDHHECDMHPHLFRKFIMDDPGFELLEYRKFMFSPTGFIPYLGFRIDPRRAFLADMKLASLRFLNPLFVNQCVVARKKQG